MSRFWRLVQKYFRKLIFDFLSKNGQMLSLMKSLISVRIRRVLGIRSMEQHRLATFEMQHHNIRCNTRILKQACMLFSVFGLLENDIFHLQVQYLLQYGRQKFQTFLMCAMGPYLFANKKSFEYSLNSQNSEWMYKVIHQGYHGGQWTEILFNSPYSLQAIFYKINSKPNKVHEFAYYWKDE